MGVKFLQSAYPNLTDCPKLDADFRNPEIINTINFHEKMFQGYRFFRVILPACGHITRPTVPQVPVLIIHKLEIRE